MEKVVLKIRKKHIIDCYNKNRTRFCNTNKALDVGHNGCKYESQCIRLRKGLDGR